MCMFPAVIARGRTAIAKLRIQYSMQRSHANKGVLASIRIHYARTRDPSVLVSIVAVKTGYQAMMTMFALKNKGAMGFANAK